MTQERSFYSFLEKSLVPLCGSQDANESHYDCMTLSEGEPSRTLATERLCSLSELSLPRLVSLGLGLWVGGPKCLSRLPP